MANHRQVRNQSTITAKSTLGHSPPPSSALGCLLSPGTDMIRVGYLLLRPFHSAEGTCLGMGSARRGIIKNVADGDRMDHAGHHQASKGTEP